jgi:hypothetical protein
VIGEKLIGNDLERNSRSKIEVLTGNFSGRAEENYEKPE